MVELGAACLIAARSPAPMRRSPRSSAPVAATAAGGLLAALDLRALRAAHRLRDRARGGLPALDFSVGLVAEHSSTTTPTGYKLTAMWSSQGGSLLLWAWVLSIASSGVLYLTRSRHREIVPYATAVLAGSGSSSPC